MDRPLRDTTVHRTHPSGTVSGYPPISFPSTGPRSPIRLGTTEGFAGVAMGLRIDRVVRPAYGQHRHGGVSHQFLRRGPDEPLLDRGLFALAHHDQVDIGFVGVSLDRISWVALEDGRVTVDTPLLSGFPDVLDVALPLAGDRVDDRLEIAPADGACGQRPDVDYGERVDGRVVPVGDGECVLADAGRTVASVRRDEYAVPLGGSSGPDRRLTGNSGLLGPFYDLIERALAPVVERLVPGAVRSGAVEHARFDHGHQREVGVEPVGQRDGPKTGKQTVSGSQTVPIPLTGPGSASAGARASRTV